MKEQWYRHGTLAAALAEAGDFPAAIAAQEQALKLLKAEKEPDAKAVAECEKRLALYRDGKPYRDTGDD